MRNHILTTTTRIDILPDGEYSNRKTENINKLYETEKLLVHKPLGGSDFQALLQNIYDGTIISDTDGNILDTNERACHFLKCKNIDITGCNIVSLLYGSDISLIENIRSSLKENKYILIQAACVRSDGSMFPAEISVNRLALDHTVYFCFFIRDISVRREAENHLRTGNAAIQNAGNGIAVADLGGVIEYTNLAMLNLWGLDDKNSMCGMNIREFLCDDITASEIEQTISNHMIWEKELTCKTVSGSTFYVQASAASNLDSDGEIVGMVLSLLDITGMKYATRKLENTMAELRRSNEDLEQFAYAVSHDLQAPLRKISMFADIIKSKETSNLLPSTTDALDRMQNASRRMSELIQGLLQYSRVSSREKPREILDLNEIISEVIADLDVPLLETEGRVNVGQMPEIIADPLQMRQLFQNLIGNALKFHKPGLPPVVDISARVFPADETNSVPYCEIEVKDNGIGFPEKDAERIFGVFQKLHKPAEYEGTGIGLAICRKIAERHNGDLIAEGNNGEGASFRVTLPQGNIR